MKRAARSRAWSASSRRLLNKGVGGWMPRGVRGAGVESDPQVDRGSPHRGQAVRGFGAGEGG